MCYMTGEQYTVVARLLEAAKAPWCMVFRVCSKRQLYVFMRHYSSPGTRNRENTGQKARALGCLGKEFV